MTAEEYKAMLGVPLDLDERMIKGATATSDGAMLMGTQDDFENLADELAATFNHMSPGKKRKLLDGVCDKAALLAASSQKITWIRR